MNRRPSPTDRIRGTRIARGSRTAAISVSATAALSILGEREVRTTGSRASAEAHRAAVATIRSINTRAATSPIKIAVQRDRAPACRRVARQSFETVGTPPPRR